MSVDALTALDRTVEVAVRVREVMENDLQRRGLTVAQAAALFHLRHRGPMVQRELSEALGCSPRHVTSLVDALEETGLVRREAHPEDRRAWLVTLTDRGVELAQAMERDRREAARRLFADLAEPRVASYISMLEHVLERLPHVAASVGVRPPR